MKIIKQTLSIFLSIVLISIPTINYCLEPEISSVSNGLNSINRIDNTGSDSAIKPFAATYNKSIALTGDSYSGLLSQFEGARDIIFHEFCYPGQTVLQNEELMTKAALSDSPVLIISVGVNDHLKLTPPYIFEATLRGVIYNAIKNKKVIIIHSFVDYPASKFVDTKYKISYYDGALLRIADDFEQVKYIDMNECTNNNYFSIDGIHYNKDFYDVLYDKIIELLLTIDF